MYQLGIAVGVTPDFVFEVLPISIPPESKQYVFSFNELILEEPVLIWMDQLKPILLQGMGKYRVTNSRSAWRKIGQHKHTLTLGPQQKVDFVYFV